MLLQVVTIVALPTMFILTSIYVASSMKWHRRMKEHYIAKYEAISDNTEYRQILVDMANDQARYQTYATWTYFMLSGIGGFSLVTIIQHIWGN